MQDFFAVTEADLVEDEKLIFLDNEIVKMQCVDMHVNNQNGSIMLKCIALTGPHKDKKTTLFLNSKDNATSKKMKAQFIKAFYSLDEIKRQSCPPARLIARIFSVKSSVNVSTKDGKTYQNWQDFQDIGAGTADAQAATSTPTASPAAAPPSASSNGMPTF